MVKESIDTLLLRIQNLEEKIEDRRLGAEHRVAFIVSLAALVISVAAIVSEFIHH